MPKTLQKALLWIAVGMLVAAPVRAAQSIPSPEDYAQLLTFIKSDNLTEPLLLLADSQGAFDQHLNRENLAYLNQNKSLLEGIQQRLDAQTLRWKLSSSTKRLLVVPETRPAYARLFEAYCRNAIDYALDQTKLPNPYLQIATLHAPVDLEEASADDGIRAYLVHNIADEYVEEYVFFNQEDSRTKIKIKLSNRVFTGRVGSYTSKLTIGENSQVEFVRDPYTLWQDSAKNPINVLVAPVEETLHIALRPATEAAIRRTIEQVKPKDLKAVKAVVHEWMAVEEAIVGGLVARLMPDIFSSLLDGPMEKEMAESLSERHVHEQYRYLQEGIRIVDDLGVRPAIDLYTSEPARFQQMLGATQLAAAS